MYFMMLCAVSMKKTVDIQSHESKEERKKIVKLFSTYTLWNLSCMNANLDHHENVAVSKSSTLYYCLGAHHPFSNTVSSKISLKQVF